mmetsp:Transcript_26553/g.83031  ORF Transcript_26553/g.83031 Transcript_26553/m.83031 type:complete len:91 (-) Transcript_26553:1233-1505(-)
MTDLEVAGLALDFFFVASFARQLTAHGAQKLAALPPALYAGAHRSLERLQQLWGVVQEAPADGIAWDHARAYVKSVLVALDKIDAAESTL